MQAAEEACPINNDAPDLAAGHQRAAFIVCGDRKDHEAPVTREHVSLCCDRRTDRTRRQMLDLDAGTDTRLILGEF